MEKAVYVYCAQVSKHLGIHAKEQEKNCSACFILRE